MEYLFFSLIIKLIYNLLMPFVVWIVPNKVLDKTAGYIERTERRFPTKELLNQFSKLKKK